jgi:hypothetical protein
MDQYRKVKVIGKGAFGAAVLVNKRTDPRVQYVIKQVDPLPHAKRPLP